ncbi:MAG: prolyl oligopeptidase family serine peptidase, partial [Phycisphaerae bacterium]|nr:prolyl oligopeptidase family serine peptidase [Phycisphaerae bacterium]
MRYRTLFTLLSLIVLAEAATAGTIQSVMNYQSGVSSDVNGALDLKAELNYDDSRSSAPIAVVMHGFSTGHGYANVTDQAQRLRDAGFFAISVSMRGRDGSDGVRDSGGVEIHDIYDAVEAVKANYGAYIDTTNVHITGYSGGSGNAMAALTKFPDYFRLGSAFFGMSDYGYDSTDGWYNNGASANHQSQLNTDIGNPNTGGNDVEDRYHARASNLASKNNPYSEIHLFVNDNETICPKINDTKYRDNAGSSNITVYLGEAGTYEDFNSNGQNDADEEQYWPHYYPTSDRQHAGEAWYQDRLLAGSIAQPVLNNSDELFVGGFVKTKPFGLWLGDGQNAAGDLNYSLSSTSKQFSLTIATHNQAITGKLSVDTTDMAGQVVHVLLNGHIANAFNGGGTYEYDGLKHNDNLVLRVAEKLCQTGFEAGE